MPRPLENAGDNGGCIFRSERLAGLLIGVGTDAQHRTHHNGRRHEFTPGRNSPSCPVVSNLRTRLQHKSQRKRFDAYPRRSAGTSIGCGGRLNAPFTMILVFGIVRHDDCFRMEFGFCALLGLGGRFKFRRWSSGFEFCMCRSVWRGLPPIFSESMCISNRLTISSRSISISSRAAASTSRCRRARNCRHQCAKMQADHLPITTRALFHGSFDQLGDIAPAKSQPLRRRCRCSRSAVTCAARCSSSSARARSGAREKPNASSIAPVLRSCARNVCRWGCLCGRSTRRRPTPPDDV